MSHNNSKNTHPSKKNPQKSNLILALLGSLLFVITVLCGLFLYIQHRYCFPSTDDAYVNAQVVNIAPEITGAVTGVYVQNNQMVEKGELLFTIDDRPLQVRLEKAKANLKIANQTVAAAKNAIKEGISEINRIKANLELTRKQSQRILTLVKKGQNSIAAGDNIRGQLQSAEAAYEAAKNKLAKIKANLGEISDKNPRVLHAQADLNKAQLDMEHTQVKAPEKGIIANFNLRPGTLVPSGIPIFQLIESNPWWIDANYKESQLKRIHTGQKASIVLDMYPGHSFEGTVKSISYNSGSAFSLFPTENTTGNWVKVAQRFTVKVILNNEDRQYPLRLGASSRVTINTLTDKETDPLKKFFYAIHSKIIKKPLKKVNLTP